MNIPRSTVLLATGILMAFVVHFGAPPLLSFILNPNDQEEDTEPAFAEPVFATSTNSERLSIVLGTRIYNRGAYREPLDARQFKFQYTPPNIAWDGRVIESQNIPGELDQILVGIPYPYIIIEIDPHVTWGLVVELVSKLRQVRHNGHVYLHFKK